MTKQEARRQSQQEDTLINLGFTRAEAESLRRISMTLHRWYEHECNGNIERDSENADGRPFWSSPKLGRHMMYRIPDRERGAEKRLRDIIATRNGRDRAIGGPDGIRQGEVFYYLQGNPRGAALYIIRPGDVPEGKDVHGYYTRGICVY